MRARNPTCSSVRRALRSVLIAAALAISATAVAEDAEAIARTALALYRAGRRKDAAECFAKAYELTKSPIQLRNAAKAYEEAGLIEEALARWRTYHALPSIEPAKRADAAARIEALSAALSAAHALEPLEALPLRPELQASVPEPPPPPPPALAHEHPSALAPVVAPAEPSGDRDRSLLHWLLFGGGGAAVAGGAVLYLSGWQTYWRFDSMQGPGQPVTQADAESAQMRAGVGIGVAAVGLAAIAGGAISVALADD